MVYPPTDGQQSNYYLGSAWPGVELATCWSQVRRPNHYTINPPLSLIGDPMRVHVQAHVHGDERSSENAESHGHQHDGRHPRVQPSVCWPASIHLARIMVKAYAHDLGSTCSILTNVHSLSRHDGRSLCTRPRVNLQRADQCPFI